MKLYEGIKANLKESETIGDLLNEIDNAFTIGDIESIGKRFKNELDRKTIEDEVNAIEEEYGDVYSMDEDSEEYASILDELKSCISSDFSGEEENLNESESEYGSTRDIILFMLNNEECGEPELADIISKGLLPDDEELKRLGAIYGSYADRYSANKDDEEFQDKMTDAYRDFMSYLEGHKYELLGNAYDESEKAKCPKCGKEVCECDKANLKETVYGLQPEYGGRQSYYGKALVEVNNDGKTLYSYNTPIMRIKDGNIEMLCAPEHLTNTTIRHIREFMQQEGMTPLPKFKLVELINPGKALDEGEEDKWTEEDYKQHAIDDSPEGASEDEINVNLLWSYVCSNELDLAKKLLDSGVVNPNARYNRFNNDNSFIMGALRNGNYEMVDLLKSYGGTITKKEVDEYKSLMAKNSYEDNVTREALDESNKIKESEDIEVLGFKNQYGYTIQQVYINYPERTYEVGSITMRNDRTISRKDFYRTIERLKQAGFKEIKRGMKESSIPRNAKRIKVGDFEYSKDGSNWKKNIEPEEMHFGNPVRYGNDFLRKQGDIEVLEVDGDYKPKRTREYRVLQGNYGYGWDDLVSYDVSDEQQMADLKQNIKDYRENEPQYSHRVITRRMPIDEAEVLKKGSTFKESSTTIWDSETTEDDYDPEFLQEQYQEYLENFSEDGKENMAKDFDDWKYDYIADDSYDQWQFKEEDLKENIYPMIDEQINNDILIVSGNYNSNYPDFRPSGKGGKFLNKAEDLLDWLSKEDRVVFTNNDGVIGVEAYDHDGSIGGNLYTLPDDPNLLLEIAKATDWYDIDGDDDEILDEFKYDLTNGNVDMREFQGFEDKFIPIKVNW